MIYLINIVVAKLIEHFGIVWQDFGIFKLELVIIKNHVRYGFLVVVNMELEVRCGINSHLVFSNQWINCNF